jgi:hypothetical protein
VIARPDLSAWRQASQGAIVRAREAYGQEQVDRFLQEADALRGQA